MDNINTTISTGEPVTEQAPTTDTPGTAAALFGVCHQSIRSLAKASEISCSTVQYRVAHHIEMPVALISRDKTSFMYVGLDGKARYKVTWSKDPQTAREVIEHYRPDLLEAYDKHNPTGKYEPYKQ